VAPRTGNPVLHRGEKKPAAQFRDVSGTEAAPIFSMDTEW